MSLGSFKNVINKICLQIIYIQYICIENLALNNLQWLICHKTKPNQTELHGYIHKANKIVQVIKVSSALNS